MIKTINKIKEMYCLDVKKIEKNTDSTDGNVYLITASTDKYIMKIYEDRKHVISMISIHKDLAKNGLNVATIIKNKDGNYYTQFDDNKYCVLYSFLDGASIGEQFNNIDKYLSVQIAKEVRKIHEITIGKNKYNLKPIPFELKEKFSRNSVLHFDLTKGNIFYNEEWPNKIGFIDFDDAKYGPTVVEVAIIVSLLYFTKTGGVNKTGFQAFINEYYGNDETIKEEELPYIRECALKWVNYIIDNNQFDSSTNQSFEIKRNLILTEMSF